MIKKDDTNRKYSAILVDGIQKAPARSMLRAVGFTDEDFKRPQVGIASTWSQVTPPSPSLTVSPTVIKA